MNTTYKVVLGVVAGAVLGGAVVQGLHAQAGPKAYLVTETEVLDEAALAAYVPKAQAAVRAAGGRPGYVSSTGGKIVAVVGEAPKRYGISEWDGLAKAQAWLNSADRKALAPDRERAFKTTRQFVIEARAN